MFHVIRCPRVGNLDKNFGPVVPNPHPCRWGKELKVHYPDYTRFASLEDMHCINTKHWCLINAFNTHK